MSGIVNSYVSRKQGFEEIMAWSPGRPRVIEHNGTWRPLRAQPRNGRRGKWLRNLPTVRKPARALYPLARAGTQAVPLVLASRPQTAILCPTLAGAREIRIRRYPFGRPSYREFGQTRRYGCGRREPPYCDPGGRASRD